MLIVISGLPGTGKTAVAAALAGRLGATHLSVDPIEDALLGAGLPATWQTGVAAYEAARAAAEQNLALGAHVVVDAVNDSEPARGTWRTAVEDTGTDLVFVLLRLDDVDEHRRRLEGRGQRFPHVAEPSWADVLARAEGYAPWSADDCLHVDARPPVEDVVRKVLDRLPGR